MPRSAKEIIDQAIAENRWNERLCYLFAVVFVTSGTATLIFGLIQGNGIISWAGAVANLLYFPAMKQAREIRKENFAIRLLEVPLSASKTSKDAAEALTEFFGKAFQQQSTKEEWNVRR
jgi:hypothetical protein